eukprot:gene9412-10398_t
MALRVTSKYLTEFKIMRKFCRCLATTRSKRADKFYKERASKLVDKIIRVDHAGEFGADRIYAGQMAVLKNSSVGSIIQKMWDDEKAHLKMMNELILKHRARPTVLLPFWDVAGFALGAGTALLGEKAAMACTIAVEEDVSLIVVNVCYVSQLRELLSDSPEDHKELLEIIHQFRDEELEHHDIGKEMDGEKAPFYDVMKTIIQAGCRSAIWLSEKI